MDGKRNLNCDLKWRERVKKKNQKKNQKTKNKNKKKQTHEAKGKEEYIKADPLCAGFSHVVWSPLSGEENLKLASAGE